MSNCTTVTRVGRRYDTNFKLFLSLFLYNFIYILYFLNKINDFLTMMLMVVCFKEFARIVVQGFVCFQLYVVYIQQQQQRHIIEIW